MSDYIEKLKYKHILEELVVYSIWLEADTKKRKKIVTILAKKQADEIIQKIKTKFSYQQNKLKK